MPFFDIVDYLPWNSFIHKVLIAFCARQISEKKELNGNKWVLCKTYKFAVFTHDILRRLIVYYSLYFKSEINTGTEDHPK